MSNDPLPRRIAWFSPWTWKRRTQLAITVACLVLVVYPLSYGPANVLTICGVLPVTVVETVYQPISWLKLASPTFRDWATWYVAMVVYMVIK